MKEVLRSISRLLRELRARSVLSRCDGRESSSEKRVADSRATDDDDFREAESDQREVDWSALRSVSVSLRFSITTQLFFPRSVVSSFFLFFSARARFESRTD